jgi:hypothetical protein
VYFQGTIYSPKEAAWPGWKFYAAVDMSPTNSIWRDAPAFFDYISRTQSFLQSGTPDNDFLLYLPLYDMWHEQRGNYFATFAIHGIRRRIPEFCEGVERIMSCGYDLDYISDRFIQTTTVENGLLKTESGAHYKALILPSVKRIPVETLSRIHELAAQGATIVFAGQYPEDVPGLSRLAERRQDFTALMERFPEVPSFEQVSENKTGKGVIITGKNRYAELLATFSAGKEAFVSDFGGKLIRRAHEGGHLYFFSMLKNTPVDGWMPLGVHARSAVFFDAMTGRTGKARLRHTNGVTEVYLQLRPGESILLKTFADNDVRADEWNYYRPTGTQLALNDGWEMCFTESAPQVNGTFKLPTLGSWTALANDTLKKNMGTARYSIRFDFHKTAGKEYRLCLGDVRESAAVKVNGQSAGVLFAVPFETNIGALLRDGANILEIEVTNLPANRIADYDRQGIEWRIFHEINFVDITYSDTRFDKWQPLDSGLLGPVTIQEVRKL